MMCWGHAPCRPTAKSPKPEVDEGDASICMCRQVFIS